MTGKNRLRKLLREQRRMLSEEQQRVAADAIWAIVNSCGLLNNAHKVGLYIANDGEIDPAWILNYCWRQGLKCYLPVIAQTNENTMQFLQVLPETTYQPNRFGIDEPISEISIAVEQLDVLFMPLVGFDGAGNRIGMGAGYYDRALAFMQEEKSTGPVLVGLAHQCQKVDVIDSDHWDVPLSYVVTDQECIKIQ